MTTRGWLGVISGLGAIALSVSDRAAAQVVPDASLGTERSVVAPNTVIRGVPSDRIDGGALRGINLFHSFEQFNVGAGRGVYFANPTGVENILSRVTGNSRSEILGRLGVLGNANLFLLNPSGIVFGANASLDVAGSFTASTANAIALGTQGFFSATQPENSSFLAIAPGALFFDQQVRQPRTIQNSGNLTTGRDLTLSADNLDLQGQVRSGGNLTLQAQDTLRIRDSVTAPFIASAGGKLLVQGDRSVDIFALNHPNSGLFSGGDMVLRSANTVGGDAHYTAGGTFRIERLDTGLGNLYSPYDPVIRASGDVAFFAYEGASLHIFAGGSVTIPGYVWIQSADPSFGLPEQSVVLANGSVVTINGQAQATLDIRAGTTAFNPPGNSGLGITGNIVPPANASNSPTSASISVGTILFAVPPFDVVNGTGNTPLKGKVLLTNQYQPNSSLSGDIQLTSTVPGILRGQALVNGDFLGGGDIDIHSKGDINVNGTVRADPTPFALGNTTLAFGNGGNVTLRAGKDITLTPGSLINSSGRLGGIINVDSNGTFSVSGLNGDPGGIASVSSSSLAGEKGGNINVKARAIVLTDVGVLSTDNIKAASGEGGNIIIQTQTLTATGGSEILARTTAAGNAGNISVEPLDPALPSTITVSGYAPFVRDVNGNIAFNLDGSPKGGFSSGLFVTTENELASPQNPNPTPAKGNAGLLLINNISTLNLENGGVLSARTKSQGNAGPDASGNGNFVSIFVNVQDLNITGGGQILAPTYSTGVAGNIIVNASGTVTIQGKDANYLSRRDELTAAFLPPNPTREQVNIAADRALTTIDPIAPNSGIYVSDLNTILDPDGLGKPGTILVRANAVQMFEAGLIEASTSGTKDAEAIGIFTQNLSLAGGSEIVSQTFGSGKAGGIYVRPLDSSLRSSASVTLSGIAPYVGLDSNGNPTGGFSSGLFVTTENQIDPITQQPIVIKGAGGLIDVETGVLQIADAAVLSARSRSSGNGGDIKINADRLDLSGGGQILTVAYKDGDAGNITVTTSGAITIAGQDLQHLDRFNQIQDAILQDLVKRRNEIEPTDKDIIEAYERTRFTVDPFNSASGLQANVGQDATANAGFIDVTAGSLSIRDNGEIGTSIAGVGDAGNVRIQTNGNLVSLDNSRIFSTIDPGGEGNGGNILISTGSLVLTNKGQLQTLLRGPTGSETRPAAKGDAGNVIVIATDSVSLSNESAIFSTIELGAEGKSDRFAGNFFDVLSGQVGVDRLKGTVLIQTGNLSLSDNSALTTSTLSKGNAGAIAVLASGDLSLTNSSFILSEVGEKAEGTAGGIVVQAGSLSANNTSRLSTSTSGKGFAGFIFVQSDGTVSLNGAGSGIFSAVGASSTDTGGAITIFAKNIFITNNAAVSVSNDGLSGAAGDIKITTGKAVLDRNGSIEGTTQSGRGGNIELNADKYLLLRRNSNVSTSAGLRLSDGDGGKITINTPFIIAAPSRNSNIRSESFIGAGGIITINGNNSGSTGLFGIARRSRDFLTSNDITTRSQFGPSGFTVINALDTSLVENNLSELSQAFVDPNTLLANSCIVRNRDKNRAPSGTFLVTGSGGLPIRPSDPPPSPFPTGEVRSLPQAQTNGAWQPGDPIVEPQGIYRLASGKLVMSRECEP